MHELDEAATSSQVLIDRSLKLHEDEAVHILQSVLARGDCYAGRAAYHLGKLHLAMGQPLLAKHFFETALCHDPDHNVTLYFLAKVLQALGQLDEAGRSLEALLAKWPEHQAASILYVEVLFQLEEARKAKQFIDTRPWILGVRRIRALVEPQAGRG